ncbi:hypothetical protein GALL_544060 [mine drainage metagenome]|uniref:Uncharacterized protein n=1 Tax=mine drainage metagenome TaxID=410659 RepID=A0A1J5P8B8_9ZZZZ
MMRTYPHVQEGQRPEVNDGQAIRENRTTGLLGHEVVHHPQERCGQEETHCIMAIPPLSHRILRTREQAVRLHRKQTDRYREVIEGMQQCRCQNKREEEPVGNVNMRLFAAHDRTYEHSQVCHPDHFDQNVDRPFHFRIFAALGITQHITDIGQENSCLPTPEGKAGHAIADQSGLTGPLHHIIRCSEERATAKTKNHTTCVCRTQAPEGNVRNIKIQKRPSQFGCNIYTY